MPLEKNLNKATVTEAKRLLKGRLRRMVLKLLGIPSIVICLLAIGYCALRLVLSSPYVSRAVQARLMQDLNCDVTLGRASISPIGTLAIEDLRLSYRKADGRHEVFKADSLDVEFDPRSLLESRMRVTSVKMLGAALSFERDSEGWLTLGRIVRPGSPLPALSIVVEAEKSKLRFGDVSIPVEYVTAEVTRTGERLDIHITDSSLLGGTVEGNASITLQEDPLLNGQFTFRGISLSKFFGEMPDAVFDVQGQATCVLALHGRASAEQLLTTESHLVIKDFSVSLIEGIRAKGAPPICSATQLDVRPLTAPHPTGPMRFAVTVEHPEIFVREFLECRNRPELIPTSQRMTAVMAKIGELEFNVSGQALKLVIPYLVAKTDKFEGQVLKTGQSLSLRGFMAQLWGGALSATASFYWTDTTWFCDGRVDLKTLGLHRLTTALPSGQESGETPADSVASRLGGWLTADFTFRARVQAGTEFTGNGNVAVRRALLWSLPCFACVARELNLPEEATSQPQEFRCTFAADGDKVNFSRLELTNDRIKVYGKGFVYYSGDVELDLGLNVVPKSPSGILTTVQRHRVTVSGDLGSPDATIAGKSHKITEPQP